MAIELATAYFNLVPSTKGLKAAVEGAIGAPIADTAKKSGKALGDGLAKTPQLKGFNDAMSKAQSNLVGIGIAAAALGTVASLGQEASRSASDLNESTNAAKVTFGSASREVEAFAAKSAVGLGLSKRAALDTLSGFGNLTNAVGFSEKASASYAQSLTRLASDLASTFGGSVEQAGEALRALFRGEGDPIEKYGVKIQETDTLQQGLRLGLARTTGELSAQDKTLARLTLVYLQTTKAQGDFTRTQADLANQQRIFAAESENAKAALGGLINPTVNSSLTGLNVGLEKANGFLDKFGTSAGEVVKKGAGILPVIGPAIIGLDHLGDSGKKSGDQFKDFDDALRVWAQESAAGRGEGALAQQAIARLKDETTKAEATQKGFAAAMTDSATAAAKVRDEMAAAATAVQGFVASQRAVTDAEQAVRDARSSVADAEQRLTDLRARGPVDAAKVADAERAVAVASRSVADARRGLATVEEEIKRLRAGPTADEAGDADRSVRHADLDLERANKRLEEARKTALHAAKGTQADQAALDVKDAELGVADAIDRQNGARKEQADLLARGKDGSAEMKAAKEREKDAQDGLAGALATEKNAGDDLRKAQAGDPAFARDMAKATEDVARAHEAVRRAEQDLPGIIAAANLQLEAQRAQLATNTDAANAYRDALRQAFPPVAGDDVRRPTAPAGPIAGDDIRRPNTTTSTRSKANPFGLPTPTSSPLAPAVAPSGLHVSVHAPVDAQTAAQIEQGARVGSWLMRPIGRP